MTEQQCIELNTLLRQGILLLEELEQIYDKELDALGEHDLNKLSSATQEKLGLVGNFHDFIQKRLQLLESFGLQIEADSYQLPENTKKTDAAMQVSESYDKIKQHLNSLQLKNKRNEQVVYRSNHNIENLLAIVRGHKEHDHLYNSSGGSGLYKAQNRIGKA